MGKIDNFLDREIARMVVEANAERDANHKGSGKLSASQLGNPLQWQILKSLGIPQKVSDEYTLRKFKRGNDIEDWYLKAIPNVVDTNVFVEYRNVVGYIDAVVKTDGWDWPIGEVPLEVKSVTNAKFKRIVKQLGPDRSHCLQGCLYALAKGVKSFPISYIAADDYRVHTYIIQVSDWLREVDNIITRFDMWKESGKVPVFEPAEGWQANKMYNNYPDWSELNEEEIEAKLKTYDIQSKRQNGKGKKTSKKES